MMIFVAIAVHVGAQAVRPPGSYWWDQVTVVARAEPEPVRVPPYEFSRKAQDEEPVFTEFKRIHVDHKWQSRVNPGYCKNTSDGYNSSTSSPFPTSLNWRDVVGAGKSLNQFLRVQTISIVAPNRKAEFAEALAAQRANPESGRVLPWPPVSTNWTEYDWVLYRRDRKVQQTYLHKVKRPDGSIVNQVRTREVLVGYDPKRTLYFKHAMPQDPTR